MVDIDLALPDGWLDGEDVVLPDGSVFEYRQEIKEQHAVLLDMLARFSAVCEKEGLRWFAAGGTLLGACRDGRIVPWDDDIDVIMPRVDFDMLVSVAKERLGGSGWRLRGCRLDNTASMTLCWMRVDGSEIVGSLDVFAMDDVPNTARERNLMIDGLRRLRCLLKFGRFNKKNWYRKAVSWCTRWSGKDNADGVFLGWGDGKAGRMCWKWSLFDDFEHRLLDSLVQVRIPKGWDEFLTVQYGKDWRIPKRAKSYHGGGKWNNDR